MRIPLTLLSGYLGAGKTSTINAVLADNPARRLAVLVNDFGAVNVDASLIAQRNGHTIALTNGCVCCSIQDDLGTALDTLVTLESPPEHVLVEASGVAEPARLANQLGHWPGFQLEAVAVAADAETIEARARDKFVGGLIERQLQTADLILLTKGDLAGPARTQATQDWLRNLNPTALVLEAPEGRVPPDLLLGPHVNGTARRSGAPPKPVAFQTAFWKPEAPVDREKLARTLAHLPPEIHRVKGFVTDAENGETLLVQAVGKHVRISAEAPGAPSGLAIICAGPTNPLDQAISLLNSTQSHGPALASHP